MQRTSNSDPYRAERERKERELPRASSAFQARRGGRVLTRYFNRHLQRLAGIRSTQLDVLAEVSLPHNHNARIAVLARQLGLAACTLSRSLKRLEMNGLVTSEIGRGDKRERWVKLTELGKEFLRRGQETIETIPQLRMTSRLGAEMCKRIRVDSEKLDSATYIQTREETFVDAGIPFWNRSYYEKRWAGWTPDEILHGKPPPGKNEN